MEFMTRTVLTSHLRPRGLRPIVIPIFILGAHAPSTSSADAISLKAFTLIHRFSGLEASTETSNKRHVVSNDTETSDQLGPVTLSFSSVGVRLDPSLDAALKTTITSAVRPSGFQRSAQPRRMPSRASSEMSLRARTLARTLLRVSAGRFR